MRIMFQRNRFLFFFIYIYRRYP